MKTKILLFSLVIVSFAVLGCALTSTVAPLPTYTLYPTYTTAPLIIPTQAPAEALPTTSIPTESLPAISTPIPTAAGPLDTPAGTILQKGLSWRQSDLSLVLLDVTLVPKILCAGFNFDLNNNSNHDVILTVLLDQFTVKDNTGRVWTPRALSHYVYCGDPGPWNDSQISNSISPGGSFWDGGYTSWIVSFDGPLTDPQVTDIYITVNGLSRFTNATWVITIR